MIIEDKFNTVLQSDIADYFCEYGYKIIDILKCLTYLRENELLRSYEDVLNENIEAYCINCPIDFLDSDYIVRNDNDYIAVGINSEYEYLNIYVLHECDGFERLLKDNLIKEME